MNGKERELDHTEKTEKDGSKNQAKIDKKIPQKLKDSYLKNENELQLQREFLSSLYVNCRRHEGKADLGAVKAARDIIIFNKDDPTPDAPNHNVFHDLAENVNGFLSSWQEGSWEESRLRLTPEWLSAWLFVVICNPKEKTSLLQVYLYPEDNSPTYSPEETITFLNKLATLGLYAIHWMKTSVEHGEAEQGAGQGRPEHQKQREHFADVEGGSKALMKAILYLIAEYAHVKGELTRRAELHHTLDQIWANEAMLYTIRDTYRDHINHMVETCLLGLLLLDLKNEHGGQYFSPLFEKFGVNDNTGEKKNHTFLHKLFDIFKGENNSGEKNKQKLLRNWIVTAMLHDTGYALEICRQAGRPLKFMDSARQVKAFAEGFKQWFNQGQNQTCENIHDCLGKGLGWVKKDLKPMLKEFDHGVVSAYFTLFLVKDRDAPDQQWREDIREALNAMARHNLKRYSTSCTKDPLAFLLILCDHLQEWDRPLLDATEMRHSLVVHLLGKEWAGFDQDSLVKYLEVENVTYNTDNNNLRLVAADRPLTFRLHYREPGHERYHPPPSWVSLTYDFQSLKDCPWDIRIELVHPVMEDRVPEMELFQACLRKHPEMSVLRDWAVKSRQKQDWFQYRQEKIESAWVGEKDRICEIFTLNLKQIKGKTILPELPKGYMNKYLEFYKERYPFR